jgi:predicted molibdopterin-dependent oxidoreductase YjgC
MFRKLHESACRVAITVDGASVPAEPGESVAAVLLRLEPPLARTTAVGARPRGPYCMMGVCFDCLAVVDGRPSTQTCRTVVQDGMRVERQHGAREVGR